MHFGLMASIPAMATLCFWPPDSKAAYFLYSTCQSYPAPHRPVSDFLRRYSEVLRAERDILLYNRPHYLVVRVLETIPVRLLIFQRYSPFSVSNPWTTTVPVGAEAVRSLIWPASISEPFFPRMQEIRLPQPQPDVLQRDNIRPVSLPICIYNLPGLQ